MSNIPFEEVTKMLLSEKCNRFIFAIFCTDCAALYFYRVPLLWMILVFCTAWLVWAMCIFLYQWFHLKKERKERQKYLQIQESENTVKRKNLAADAFLLLEEFKKDLLCYAYMKGRKSKTYSNLWLYSYQSDKFAGQLFFVNEISAIHNPDWVLTNYQNRNGEISFTIAPELVLIIQDEIKKNQYTLDIISQRLENFFDKDNQ